MSSESVTLSWLVRLGLAFGLTSVPVESLKVRALRQGALPTWSAMLSSYDVEQQQIALGALCALLEGDAPLQAFWEEAGWFDALVHALPPLVHEGSASLQQPEILYDTLDLSNAIVSHPIFLHSHGGDVWLWERLLEMTAVAVPFYPEASLQWACLAASASERHDVALAMLSNPEIKRALAELANDDTMLLKDHVAATVHHDASSSPVASGGDAFGGGGSGGFTDSATGGGSGDAPPVAPPSVSLGGSEWWRDASGDDLEMTYARAALARLAQTADGIDASELSPEELAERREPFTHRYMHYTAPPLPSRPPGHALRPPDYERLASALASYIYCAAGGLLWGALAGSLAQQRARRPVWRSALLTMGGAVLFEGLMQFKSTGLNRMRAMTTASSPPVTATTGSGLGGDGAQGQSTPRLTGGGTSPAPLYSSLRGFVVGMSADIMLSTSMLLVLIQPTRFPLAFGGWALGRLVVLSQEMETVVLVAELESDE